MLDTTIGTDTAEPISGDARGYRFIDGAWQEEENAIHWGASAGIVSTIEDLLKWAVCLRDPVAAGLPWVGDITRASPFNDGNPATYACGINHAINAVGNPKREVLAHAGALRGWRSTLMHFVAEDTSIAVFMNRTNSPKVNRTNPPNANRTNPPKGKLVRGVANEILEALKIAPIWRRGRAKPVKAKLPRGAVGAYVSREQGLLIQLRDDGSEAQVFSHLDWSTLCQGSATDTVATEDRHLQLRFDAPLDSPSQLTLTMRDENVHTVMQHIKPAKPTAGPFKFGGRFTCAPINSSVEVFLDDAKPKQVALAFTGIFGEGVVYRLTVINNEVAWFDLSRGVDESPPGRVLVVFDAIENAIEVSCMLARRVRFRRAA
jgi:hypothetical protein